MPTSQTARWPAFSCPQICAHGSPIRPPRQAYPIVTYTWLLCYKKYTDPRRSRALKSVIEYGLTQGQTFSDELGYIPLPASVVDADKKALAEIS